jgi:hypothetical protein
MVYGRRQEMPIDRRRVSCVLLPWKTTVHLIDHDTFSILFSLFACVDTVRDSVVLGLINFILNVTALPN